jgi:hypothetical protein
MTISDGGVRLTPGGNLSPAAVAEACHVLIDNASAFLSTIEFLEEATRGSKAEREAAVYDARGSVLRLVEVVRDLQTAARAA